MTLCSYSLLLHSLPALMYFSLGQDYRELTAVTVFESPSQTWEVENNWVYSEDVSSRGDKEKRRKRTVGRKSGACSLEGVFLGKSFIPWTAEL